MAKYKNWYLTGESGMKDERKKLKLIILQCIAVITANLRKEKSVDKKQKIFCF